MTQELYFQHIQSRAKSSSNNVNPSEAHWVLIIYRLLKRITRRSPRYLRLDLYFICHDDRAAEHEMIRRRRRRQSTSPSSSSLALPQLANGRTERNGNSHKGSRAAYLAVSRIIFDERSRRRDYERRGIRRQPRYVIRFAVYSPHKRLPRRVPTSRVHGILGTRLVILPLPNAEEAPFQQSGGTRGLLPSALSRLALRHVIK